MSGDVWCFQSKMHIDHLVRHHLVSRLLPNFKSNWSARNRKGGAANLSIILSDRHTHTHTFFIIFLQRQAIGNSKPESCPTMSHVTFQEEKLGQMIRMGDLALPTWWWKSMAGNTTLFGLVSRKHSGEKDGNMGSIYQLCTKQPEGCCKDLQSIANTPTKPPERRKAKMPHREQRVSHSKTSKTSLVGSTNVNWQLRERER